MNQNGIRRDRFVTGYTRVGIEAGDGAHGAGYSLYSAVWPLLQEYPGHDFQSGLFGTWMYADSEVPKGEGLKYYSTLEGGLGWWRDTEYPTETPKFIMGAVAMGFSAWANGPGAGKGRDWENPKGHYGVAQLSPNLLWPPDGLNMAQGTCGELLGYGYLPLPLTKKKATTSGAAVPTGDHGWTLFLNAANFKGPATVVLPYFYAQPTVDAPALAGTFLDSCLARQARTHSMETQYIPWAQATDAQGRVFGRMAPTRFPAPDQTPSAVLHQVTAYNKQAFWDRVQAWFDGGAPADSRVDPAAACRHAFDSSRGVEWAISEPGLARSNREPIQADDFVAPVLSDPYSLAYAEQSDLVRRIDVGGGRTLLVLPEYYQQVDREKDGKGRWVAVPEAAVPAETGLHTISFARPVERPPQTYVTPADPQSCWETPGPVAGPFEARPGDGSVVTYYWYRFADQPALLNADLSDAERAAFQSRVEKLHQHWTPEREYLEPPGTGELAMIDPALIVTPPAGLDVGYVPIATRQEPG